MEKVISNTFLYEPLSLLFESCNPYQCVFESCDQYYLNRERSWRQLASCYVARLSMLTSTLLSMVRRVLRTEESLMVATEFFIVLPCDTYPVFVQQVIQDIFLALFTAVPLSGRLLVRSFYHWTVAIASYVRNWLFVSRGCGYVRANHSTGLPYDKFVITIVECDTWKKSLVHCLRYYYSCFTLITILGNGLVIFPGITFYYGNN